MASGWDQFPLADAGAQPKGWDSFPLEHGIDFKGPDDQVRKAIAGLPEGQRKGAYRMWAKAKVAADKPNRSTAASIGMNLAAGTPIGSFLDEMAGAYSAATGGSYDEGKASYEARQKAAEDESTSLGTLPLIGEVKTSGVQKVLGGILSAPLSPVASIVKGTTMLPRIANSMATGAGYGALYGAGEGEGADRAVNAAKGVGIGAGIGVAAPVIASGVSKAAAGVKSMASPLPKELQQFSKGAVDRVGAGLEADDLASKMAQKAAELGPDGMLADMGPNLRSQAGALANQPGEAKSVLTSAIEGRRAEAPARIDKAMTGALGSPRNIPDFIETWTKGRKQDAAPFYAQFYTTPIKPTPQLASLLERADAAGAVKKAAEKMRMQGIDPNDASNNGMFMDLIKRSVDDLAFAAGQGTDDARILKGLSNEIRKEVDGILVNQGAVAPHPDTGKPTGVWEIARYYASDYKRTQDAIEAGQKAFSTGVHPDQMAADLAKMNPLDQTTFRYGARDAARTKMGNAGAAYGPSGDVAARRAFQSDFSKDKMRQIVGDQRAGELDRVLKAESEFARTQDDVLRNSKTADRLAAQELYPSPAGSKDTAFRLGQRSLTGTGMELVYRMGNTLMGGALNERRAKIASDAAEMLIAQGADRDQISRALIQYMGSKKLTQQQADNLDRFMRSFLTATRGPAIESQTNP